MEKFKAPSFPFQLPIKPISILAPFMPHLRQNSTRCFAQPSSHSNNAIFPQKSPAPFKILSHLTCRYCKAAGQNFPALTCLTHPPPSPIIIQ